MRFLVAAVAVTGLSLSACARDLNVRAETQDNTQQELVEAGKAVEDAAGEVDEAARHVIEDAANSATDNAAKSDQPAPAPAQ